MRQIVNIYAVDVALQSKNGQLNEVTVMYLEVHFEVNGIFYINLVTPHRYRNMFEKPRYCSASGSINAYPPRLTSYCLPNSAKSPHVRTRIRVMNCSLQLCPSMVYCPPRGGHRAEGERDR